jgi:hypothetical protein
VHYKPLIDEMLGLKQRVARAAEWGGELLQDLSKVDVVVVCFLCSLFRRLLVLSCLAHGSRLWQVAGYIALHAFFFRASFAL